MLPLQQLLVNLWPHHSRSCVCVCAVSTLNRKPQTHHVASDLVRVIKLEHVRPYFGKVSLLEPSLPLKWVWILVLCLGFCQTFLLKCFSSQIWSSRKDKNNIYIYSIMRNSFVLWGWHDGRTRFRKACQLAKSSKVQIQNVRVLRNRITSHLTKT